MIDAMCVPHKSKGRLMKATQMVGQTPMCNECFLEAKRTPAVPEVQTAAIPSALANLNAVEDEARAAGQWRKKTPHSNGRERVQSPAPTRRFVDERTVSMPKDLGIDWDKVQRERNAGTRVAELAEKYGASEVTIYSRTKPASNGAGAAHRANAKPRAQVTKTSPRTGGQYDQVIADLVAKRDRLNQVIEGLQELAGA